MTRSELDDLLALRDNLELARHFAEHVLKGGHSPGGVAYTRAHYERICRELTLVQARILLELSTWPTGSAP